MIAAGTVFLDAVFTGHFDHCFVCLGAGVLEKDFVHTDAGADLLGSKNYFILAPVLVGVLIRKASPQTPFLRLPSKKPYSWGSLSSRIHWLMPVR